MASISDALMEVTGSFRINYEILGNLHPALHAQIIPRYLSEPEKYRLGPPLFYDKTYRDPIKFDLERDKELMEQLARAIQRRLTQCRGGLFREYRASSWRPNERMRVTWLTAAQFRPGSVHGRSAGQVGLGSLATQLMRAVSPLRTKRRLKEGDGALECD